jgi:hypothetical protein
MQWPTGWNADEKIVGMLIRRGEVKTTKGSRDQRDPGSL